MSELKLLQRLALAAALLGGAITGNAWADDDRGRIRFSSVSWQEEAASARDEQAHVVSLGMDKTLQRSLRRLLVRAKPTAGAATLIDARTGQVLAAAEIGETQGGSLLFDPIAPAASLFKIVTTAALFEHTSVTPMTRVCTQGGQRDILREHLSPARGPNARCGRFAHALGVSRNAAYAQLATQKLLRGDLVDTATRMGFGSSLHLDSAGRMGKLDVPFNDLSFARTAAGFENSRLSVFGAAQMALTVASGGILRTMHFQKDPPKSSRVKNERAFSPRTARRLRDAMEVTIHSGTARSSFVNERGRSTVGPVQVAGKTGTLKLARGGPTSSWFIGFAPSENPRVVVSVLLQNPDKWHQKGHQVGRDLLKAYLAKVGVRGVKSPL